MWNPPSHFNPVTFTKKFETKINHPQVVANLFGRETEEMTKYTREIRGGHRFLLVSRVLRVSRERRS